MSLRILIVALLIAGVAYGMMSPGNDLKPVSVVEGLPGRIPFDSAIMVVTNRVIEDQNENQLPGNFIDSSDVLHYALAIERPERFDLYYVQDFNTLMDLMPQSPLTVYVHGDGNYLDKALWRSSMMKDLYGNNVLVFSWPTRLPDYSGIKNLKNSMANAGYTKKHLSILLHQLDERFKTGVTEHHTHKALLLHSLGNYLLEHTVESGSLSDLSEDLFDVVLINAACTPSGRHAGWLNEMHMQKHTYVISSKNDVNLMGAQYFTSLPRLLGQEPVDELADGVNYIDMTEALGFTFKRSKSHTYFVGEGLAENPVIYEFYKRLLTDGNNDLSDLGQLDKHQKVFVIKAENG